MVTMTAETYDRKVVKMGNTRVLCVGRIIPDDWQYVRITVKKAKNGERYIEIRKLL
jgi:hypothetical protein